MMLKYLSLYCLALMLGGCNTVEGVGKDMKKLGDKIQSSAEKNNEKSK